MRLELLWSEVTAMRAGAATRLDAGVLEIDVAELEREIGRDPRLVRARIELAGPGESCRIGRVFDVIAPRAKVDGREDFPGVLGALGRVGSGRTRALGGVAVVVTDQQIENTGTLAVIDMSGPAAALSEFATHAQPRDLRLAGRRASGRSEYLRRRAPGRL